MGERKCAAGVFVCRDTAGLANEIGEWDEGLCAFGPYVATTAQHLETALRYLISQQALAARSQAMLASAQEGRPPAVDKAAAQLRLGEVRLTLSKLVQLKRQATQLHQIADNLDREATEVVNQPTNQSTNRPTTLRRCAAQRLDCGTMMAAHATPH
jgi:hypothetical protein